MLLWLLSGCLKARDLADPYDRPVTNTAFSARGVHGDVSLGGSRTEEIGARVGATVGLGKRAHLQTNVAHLAFGVVNAGGRVTPVEREGFAWSFNASTLVVRPAWMWYLPAEARRPASELTLVNVPLSTTLTVRLGDALLASTALGYDHVSVSGRVKTDSALFEGAFGARRIWVRPTTHLRFGKGFLLESTVLLPLVAWGLTDVDGDAIVAPGVRVGVRSNEWARLPALPGLVWQMTGEVRSGTTRFRFGASGNPILRELGVLATPYVGLRWAP